ncbi:high mobility group box domain-containing protein [Lipomyces japonicus]|uniref:high mobility group box domain-containing protein n=1 Tax=Lipomyces japonicus TaxID=56871 RepID=UPI0034CD4891
MSKKSQKLAPVPSIPHSEELKYRQKCKDLKKRIQDIEEQNDALTLRLSRSKRAVQRMRLERAFLLEKLEERTFLKVDDSDGTPSPPPSPPRIPRTQKRRDSDGSLSHDGDGPGGFTPISNGKAATPAGTKSKKSQQPRDPNAPKRPQNAYIIFCDHEKERVRSHLEQSQGQNYDLTRAMAEAWRDLGDEGRKPFYELYDAEKARYNREMEAYVPSSGVVNSAATSNDVASAESPGPEDLDKLKDDDLPDEPPHDAVAVDNDEEMEDVSFGGGFTAVNR